MARIPAGSLQGALRIAVAAVALALLVALCVQPVIAWLTTHFVLTNHRVVMRKGLVARSGRDVPLFRINDVTFSHGIIERLFGAGTLVIESAGEHGQVTLTDIPHVEDVQRQLYRLIEESARPGLRSDQP
ncbi:MAG: PH domain-containing protein [Mycobacteriales bacterium]|nr:PH domain-containing protein [Frankia sp.]